MADIELVIKIDEKLVEWIDKYSDSIRGFNGKKIGMVVDAIKNGKSIPKGHGRLIDADELKKEYPHDTDWDYPVNTNCYIVESIDNSPTIVEAERGDEEV